MLRIDGDSLDWTAVRRILSGPVEARLTPAAKRRVAKSRQSLQAALDAGERIYGVNTGFGKLADQLIDRTQLGELQRRLIRSHACGVGPILSEEETRTMILLRANALARGESGCTPGLVEFLLSMANAGIYPCIPDQGSVGASGDLAPLAHLGLGMLGEGKVRWKGRILGAAEGLKRAGLSPYSFRAKEALSLINGTQFSLAVLCRTLAEAERLASFADLVGAMSVDATQASARPFDERVHRARPHPGQAESARNLRVLLAGSEILASHRNCGRVQDPYSVRCIPQVHGAARETFRWVREISVREANSTTDNPLLFGRDIISAGNFHAQILAQASDALAQALTTLGNISLCRIDALLKPEFSGLPPFLTAEPGLNSGFMQFQVTAAALAAECRTLCFPASVESLPTGGGKEDHVSMAPIAARKARAIAENVAVILALEALCAARALEFHTPRKTSPALSAALAAIRRRSPRHDQDRYMKPDIDRVRADREAILEAAERVCGKLL